jgi:hypothetical protein
MAAQPPSFVIFRRYSLATDQPYPPALAMHGVCTEILAAEHYSDLTGKDIARFAAYFPR